MTEITSRLSTALYRLERHLAEGGISNPRPLAPEDCGYVDERPCASVGLGTVLGQFWLERPMR